MNGAQRYYQNSPTHAHLPTSYFQNLSISAPLQTPQSQGLLRLNTHLGNPPMPYNPSGKQVFFKRQFINCPWKLSILTPSRIITEHPRNGKTDLFWEGFF